MVGSITEKSIINDYAEGPAVTNNPSRRVKPFPGCQSTSFTHLVKKGKKARSKDIRLVSLLYLLIQPNIHKLIRGLGRNFFTHTHLASLVTNKERT